MRRKSLYIVCGFAIALAETGQLLTEVGHDLERFALGRIAGLKDSPRCVTVPVYLDGRKVARTVVTHVGYRASA